MTRLELEEEISRQKNHNMSAKLQHEEQLSIIKQKFHSEEVLLSLYTILTSILIVNAPNFILYGTVYNDIVK